MFAYAVSAALLLPAAGLNANTVQLLSTGHAGAPLIKDQKMIFTLGFVFNRCPDEFWWSYNPGDKTMDLEFLDCFITVADSIAMKPVLPVQEIEVRNISTPIVISGQRSQLKMRLKEEMHCSAVCVKDTLRVNLWKDLSAKSVFKRKNRLPAIILITALTGILAATVYFGIICNNR